MIIKKNVENSEPKENIMIEVSKKINEVNFFLKIYFSKDKESIVFKVEQENVQTYYYYEKFFILDFKQNYKAFNKMKNLNEIFQNIKDFINKHCPKFENNQQNKIKITLLNNTEMLVFTLRKKIISQNRLNPIIIEQIQENKSKIKTIKKQSTKILKSSNEQKDMIDTISGKIEAISDNLEKIQKEINNIKEAVQNNSSAIQRHKEYLEEKIENKKKKKTKKAIEEEKNDSDDEFIHKEKSFFNKERLYEVLFVINIIIIILVAYLYTKIKNIEETEKIQKIKRNKIRKKYSFITILESMSEEDLKYIQNTFETGEILNYNEEEENDNKDKKDKYVNNKDEDGLNMYKDFKDFDKNNIGEKKENEDEKGNEEYYSYNEDDKN